MGALIFYEERLQGSDWGEPVDRDTGGCDVRILEFQGFVHLEMNSATSESDDARYMALFSLDEAKEFVAAMQSAIQRVEPLGNK